MDNQPVTFQTNSILDTLALASTISTYKILAM